MASGSYIQKLREKIGYERILVASVAAIIHDDNQRLLLQRKAGSEGWSLPAGAIEPGETPLEALSREVLEETGLEIEDAKLVGAFGGEAFRHKYPNGDQVEYTVLVYFCGIFNEPGEPPDPETQELAYFEEADMPTLALPYPKDLLFNPNTVDDPD